MMFLKHSIEHENKNFFDKYVYIITIIIINKNLIKRNKIMILTNTGVLKLMQRIKSFIAVQLNTKAASVHTHSISEIDNLASQLGGGYTKSEVDTLLTDYIPKSGGGYSVELNTHVQ